MSKRILVIVDMQNDFIFRNFALGSEQAEKAYEELCNYLANLQPGTYDKIILTRDTHFNDYLQTAEGKKLPVKHCIEYTNGWRVPEKLLAAVENAMGDENIRSLVLNKYTFGSAKLPEQLARLTFETADEDCIFEFCGLCTDICVVSNVLITKAFFPEATIKVHEKFCAGVTPESHSAAISTMKSCQIDII